MKAAAELEQKERKEKERVESRLAPPTQEHAVATNWLMKQKRVMDLLHKTRKPMSAAELHNELGWPVDVPELWEMLLHNDKVAFHEANRRFSYKAKHALRDRREMLALIQKFPDGILEEDVVDAYQGAANDCAALLEAGDACALTNAESRERVLYPVDESYEVAVDEDVASAFHDVVIPQHDPDWDQALRRLGIEPAPRRTHAARAHDDDDSDDEGEKKRRKKKRAVNFERVKVTNAHLPELFKKPQVERLDG